MWLLVDVLGRRDREPYPHFEFLFRIQRQLDYSLPSPSADAPAKVLNFDLLLIGAIEATRKPDVSNRGFRSAHQETFDAASTADPQFFITPVPLPLGGVSVT
jgi:hypothetical protein